MSERRHADADLGADQKSWPQPIEGHSGRTIARIASPANRATGDAA